MEKYCKFENGDVITIILKKVLDNRIASGKGFYQRFKNVIAFCRNRRIVFDDCNNCDKTGTIASSKLGCYKFKLENGDTIKVMEVFIATRKRR